MPEEKKYELKQVSVRLKLCEETPLYSTELINTPRKAIDVLSGMMRQLDREHICILNLDNHGQALNFSVVSIGNLNSSIVTVREILKTSILSNAASIIMAHNHPSYRTEKPEPSREDHLSTLNVMMGAEIMGINLLDHVIVAGGTGRIYSYSTELGDKFSIEGLWEMTGGLDKIPILTKNPVTRRGKPVTRYERLSVRERLKHDKAAMAARERTKIQPDQQKKPER